MTGTVAYKIWAKALTAAEPFRTQAHQGLPQGYERLCGAQDVLVQLKLALIDAVTSNEGGYLGEISRELHLLQKEQFVIRDDAERAAPQPPQDHTASAAAQVVRECCALMKSYRSGGEDVRDLLELVRDWFAAAAAVPEGEYEGADGLEDVVKWVLTERSHAVKRAEFAEGTLRNAGWTYKEGAERWKPPINEEMGKLRRRLYATETERDAALQLAEQAEKARDAAAEVERLNGYVEDARTNGDYIRRLGVLLGCMDGDDTPEMAIERLKAEAGRLKGELSDLRERIQEERDEQNAIYREQVAECYALRHGLAAAEARELKLRAAMVTAEAALADIGDATREPGDDLGWSESRAAKALPTVREALASTQSTRQPDTASHV